MRLKEFIYDEGGFEVVEMVIIVLILLSLCLIFKKQITKLVNNLFDKITDQANQF